MQIRISAKALGEVALPDFCPRCFWVKQRLSNKLPFQMFPGIFSSIDAYSKHVIQGAITRNGGLPAWLPIPDVVSWKKAPHYSKFQKLVKDFDILLTGSPDGVFVKDDGSHVIPDYKCAKYTEGQERVLPLYETQLNGYALIGEATGFSPVSALYLVYTEPMTDATWASSDGNQRPLGFAMEFQAKVVPVELKTDSLLPLMSRTREIYEMEVAPDGRDKCKDCESMNALTRLFT